ncbi:hypothetical protein [Saccharibacillus kuerlensis]|uniref:DUF4025 domain-containing protein n=1 Tax=Saccharibacillus kuerlensis TaxID=459527 RepID=A0ABQ2KT83_9BACL|nr:hypothetical protein [Saccharibacillus kuerlensis]GGN92704.1 hypothetical protein GCM10010969_05510 [Saccharibacillus kuerlensis]
MDDKARKLLDQKKEHDHSGELKNFVEHQVEGTESALPNRMEATKDQMQDQQHRLKDQQNMRR